MPQKNEPKKVHVLDSKATTVSPAKVETMVLDSEKTLNSDSSKGAEDDPESNSMQRDLSQEGTATHNVKGPTIHTDEGPIAHNNEGLAAQNEVEPETDSKASDLESKSNVQISSSDEHIDYMHAQEDEPSVLSQEGEVVREAPNQELIEIVDSEKSNASGVDDGKPNEKEVQHHGSNDKEGVFDVTVDGSITICDSTSSADNIVANTTVFNERTENELTKINEIYEVEAQVSSDSRSTSEVESSLYTNNDSSYVENLKAQVKSLGESLGNAAYQAKVKADELSRILIENDNLRFTLENVKKSNDAELESLKEEFQQRLNAAERKVYALTKERDMLRREQGRRDSSILLKEKDEIIKQVMAEGEELSKKQAAQEAHMRKLRAQIRELEEEKQRLKSKLQVEEATVESLRKDKAATEKALQDAVEKTQVELAAQKEFYTKALNEAKEAEARAEVRADAEAKLELENRLREGAEREAALIQNLEELRQALSRASQQAVLREDMLRRDVEDLEKRCQAAELRYEELVASVPESTRPLLRQIEAMRETMAVRAEAWSGVERSLNARLQEAEAKAAASQERERAINERLTQTLSRMAVLEAQVSCLKAEQAQLARSLEKERQRASENRQEYLAAVEAAATHEGHAKQLEEDLKELRNRFKRELAEERTMRELLQQEVDREKQKPAKQELVLENGNWTGTPKTNLLHSPSPIESNTARSLRRFSSGSYGDLEESFFLQASLDPTADQIVHNRRNSSSSLPPLIPGKGPSLEQFEALITQKDGELALYTSRLASLESTRNALAEELVNATTQCEKFRAEAASLSGLRSELDALRRRHASALELMGERDEQVEELKADLADVKQMYREQIDMLVNQIEQLSASMGTR
ncbi:hypothetical protein KP509_20G030700 [Ceratopteris richardii]|nr:hypothetical protein KP509_20G030700 [Ceratopteris richardii]